MAASDLCSGLAELDQHWTMELVADANEYLDHEQESATAIREAFEKYNPKAGAESEAADPLREEDHLKANELINKLGAALRDAHASGEDVVAAMADLEGDFAGEFGEWLAEGVD